MFEQNLNHPNIYLHFTYIFFKSFHLFIVWLINSNKLFTIKSIKSVQFNISDKHFGDLKSRLHTAEQQNGDLEVRLSNVDQEMENLRISQTGAGLIRPVQGDR